MGDRCYVQVRVKNKDLKQFIKIAGLDESFITSEWKATSLLEIDEANYGLYEELLQAAKANIDFIGWHGAGSEYPESSFVGSGGKMIDVMSSNGRILVELATDVVCNKSKLVGKLVIDKHVMAHVQRYIKMRRKVNREFDRLDGKRNGR